MAKTAKKQQKTPTSGPSSIGGLLDKSLTDRIKPEIPRSIETQNLAIEEYVNERIKSAKIQNEDAEQNVRLRREHAGSIKELIYFYLLAVGFIVLLAGSERIRLSDTVLVAILGTTTVNVLVLYHMVVKNLFPQNEQ